MDSQIFVNLVIDLKRKFVWLWRFSCSTIKNHCPDSLKPSALWIFDTLNQPDGSVLEPLVEKVALREGLQLYSFGPRYVPLGKRFKQIFTFFRLSFYVVTPNFSKVLSKLVENQIRNIFISCNCDVLIVGASKGTFALIAQKFLLDVEVWEIQHGLLDLSYFPLDVQRFYARSELSASLVRELAPKVAVSNISRCLAPPNGQIIQINPQKINELVCYSKNPGGGCTTKELADFEMSCYHFAKRFQINFILRPHPRDSMVKLLLRHRSMGVWNWVKNVTKDHDKTSRLIISAYSSALVTESEKNDMLLNIKIGDPSDITQREYCWIPTMDLASLNFIDEYINVFKRNS